jgi:hypothetical protein
VGPDDHREAAGAVVGSAAARVVVVDPPSEFAPDEREHAVGDTVSLEVGLERRERLPQRREAVGLAVHLVVVAVEAVVEAEAGDPHAQVRPDEPRRRPRGEAAERLHHQRLVRPHAVQVTLFIEPWSVQPTERASSGFDGSPFWSTHRPSQPVRCPGSTKRRTYAAGRLGSAGPSFCRYHEAGAR